MKIRDIRKKTGLTQKEFAARFQIPLPTLQHWERDYSTPPKYFLLLLEEYMGLNDTIIFTGKRGEKYIYSKKERCVSNGCGDKIQVSDVIENAKQENVVLYLSGLFDSVSHAKKMFAMDCEEDARSDILWIER